MNGNGSHRRIRSLCELDELVGEHITGEIPLTQWEDSHAVFRFDTEEEAREAINNPYYQLFLPDVDWSKTELIKISIYRRYSSDLFTAWEVVEKLGGDKGLRLNKERGRWMAEFEGSQNAVARSVPVAICVAGLRAKGVKVEVDPDMIGMAPSDSAE